MKNDYTIGQRIKHGATYGLTCAERFQFTDISLPAKEGEFNSPVWKRNSEPTPIHICGESFIIGLKFAIMSEYKYTAGSTTQGFEDSYPEYVQAYSSGKKEECLVCVKAIKPFKPYLVRIKDIVELI